MSKIKDERPLAKPYSWAATKEPSSLGRRISTAPTPWRSRWKPAGAPGGCVCWCPRNFGRSSTASGSCSMPRSGTATWKA